MQDFKIFSLGELGEIIGGGTPSTKISSNYENGNISWITPKDLSNFNQRFISRGERNITELGLKNSSAKIMPKNSILFSSRAPIGYVAIAENELCTNQGFKSIVPNEKIYFMFLYYLMKFNTEKIKNISSGTTFAEISGTALKNFEVKIPPLEVQKKIAAVLSSLDDKIELNNKINKNLEQQAQAIFKNFFVTNFNSDFKIGTFSDIFISTFGGDWGKEILQGNYVKDVYCIRGADIPEINLGNKGKIPVRFILQKNFLKKRLSDGDIVIEISGGSPTQSTGRVSLITNSMRNIFDKELICTNFCRAIKVKFEYSYFAYYYLKYLYDKNIFFSYENGTTGIKNLNLESFTTKEEIFLPPYDLIKKFNSICDSMFEKIFSNGAENKRLAEMRDLLLPRLLNGEIDVSKVEV